jgi:acyl-CoA hydrolase/RimJ/RimL family protein N-acetyltransferase
MPAFDEKQREILEQLKVTYSDKFVTQTQIFSHIHRGAHLFVGTACGEPQFLVKSLVEFVSNNPKAFFDAEVLQVWTLGVAPYTDVKYKRNFRYNSFFVGNDSRDAVNSGLADYSPVFLSQIPQLFTSRQVPVDVALIQVSMPDKFGYVSLGVSVDIVKPATEHAKVIIAQINSQMPRVLGDSFLHIDDIDFMIHHDEPLLTFSPIVPDEIAGRVGKYVARIVQDGDTIQVGYGSLPNAVLHNLREKNDLGVHSELMSNGIARLMNSGVINNSRKTINRGKTVAAFCMGNQDTYDFIDNNPAVEFRPITYTNDPLTIARVHNMTAINTALQIDLTGQSSAESIGSTFYSGIGGQADFMRGAILAPGGKSILALLSTAKEESVSRIVPFLSEGAGVTLGRGDIHYVVTEYGIAYLHGKNVRERAMALIAIAHPKFRTDLIRKAKKLGLIYKDQAYIPGKKGEYPEHLESRRTTHAGKSFMFRPVKINDEPDLKNFFYALSDQSTYRRFISQRKDMPHERLQEFVIIDYTRELVILVVKENDRQRDEIVAVGQYGLDDKSHWAEIALVVRDDFQSQGIGTELVSYLTHQAVQQGLIGFTAEVLTENHQMLRLFEKMGFDTQRRTEEGCVELQMRFRKTT